MRTHLNLRNEIRLPLTGALWAMTMPLCAAFEDRGANDAALPAAMNGFAVTVHARDPLVRNPCSVAFDRRGRMFVSMGPQYRNPTPETPPDSVVMVEDRDGDGVADAVRTFAEGFNCVQGLAWHGRDLWVANAPDLTVVRDLDGDDVADEYVKVFTDLGNIEHGIHGLNWAPDGRLYMSKGNSKGVVIRKWKEDEPDRIAPRPFRELWGVPGPPDAPDFPEPKTFGRASYRRTYQDPRDDWGQMGGILRCDDLGRNLTIVARGLRNPYGLAASDTFDWLGTDQDQNEGDRLFMPFAGANFGWSHAWSTHWTGENHLPTVPISGPVYPGSGSGVIWADAPNWPDRFRGVWIINDWLQKSTHIYRPVWQGALVQPEGGQWETFVKGSDALYRPVDMAMGPDGALYVLGWGRGYGVEWDAAGQMTNEGRIFRIMPRDAKPLPPPDATPLTEMSAERLVAEFASILPVRRIDAQDELARRGKMVLPELAAAVRSGRLSRMQETWTLWAMARCGQDDGFFAGTARSGSFPQRLQAIRILGNRKSAALAELMDAALSDPEPRIRFAAVQAVHEARAVALVERLMVHAAAERDRVVYYAVWQAIKDLAEPDRIRPLLRHGEARIRCAALLALLDGPRSKPSREQLLTLTKDADEAVRTVAALGLGRALSEASPAKADAPAVDLAGEISAESNRSYGTGVMEKGKPSYTDRPYRFTRVPESVAGSQIIRTANEDDGSRGKSFLTFELPLDATIMVAHDIRIADRPPWLRAFADSDLTVATEDTEFRLWSRDFPRGRVTLGGNIGEKVTGAKANYFVVILPKPLPPRAFQTTAQECLDALPKARLRRGEALFFTSAACATCHQVNGRGLPFGPDLTNLGDRMDAAFLIQSMLEPSAVITEGFSAHMVEAGGMTYAGILLSTGPKLKLGLLGGTIVELPAESITKHETLPVSPMPPQGALLGPDEVADIAAWLISLKAPAETRTAQTAAPGLAVEQRDDRLIVRSDGREITQYVFRDPAILRPYFANVQSPGGAQVTRQHPPVNGVDATDHETMHPGLWLGFGDINGHDFWRNKASMEHVRFTDSPEIRNNTLRFAAEYHLKSADGVRLGSMISHIGVATVATGHLITWQADFMAGETELVFGDQEEMGFGVRVATAITEKAGGLITAANGDRTAKGTWGRAFDWCDYAGEIKGSRIGVTLMPDPANFRPSWFHNRDYGVMVANPFGRKSMQQGEVSRVAVKPGERLRLRFGAFFHASPPGTKADPAAAYREFLEQSKITSTEPARR
jgi:putative membrane-bound dehydrogenase-like protein